MSNLIFDKEYIETFAEEIDQNYVDQVISHTTDIIFSAVEDIRQAKPLILDYSLELANEFLTNSQTQNSSLQIFLIIKSPQVELNSITHTKNRFRAFWNRFLINWKSNKNKKQNKKKRRLWKRKKDKENEQQVVNVSLQKYNILDLKNELFSNLAKYLSTQTTISMTNDRFVILGKDEFGIEVNIIPVLKNGSNFRLYNDYKSKFINIDHEKRVENLKSKIESTDGFLVPMIRIFNNIYFHLMRNNPNQIFMESLLFSCPDELFLNNESVYDGFVKIANHINMTNLSSMVSIVNPEKGLFEEPLNPIGVYECKKFLNQIQAVI